MYTIELNTKLQRIENNCKDGLWQSKSLTRLTAVLPGMHGSLE